MAPTATGVQIQGYQQGSQNPILKAGITGAAVLGEIVTGGLFMENLKMEKQRTSLPYPVLAKRILSQGIRGFEAGLWPWGVILGLTKGTVLGGSKAQLERICKKANLSDKTTSLVSGFGSGAVQGVFMSPILLARTRVNQSLTERAAAGKIDSSLMAEMKLSMNILFDAVKKEGLLVLTSGMGTCVIKRALDWGTRFIFIDIFRAATLASKPANEPKKLNDTEKLMTAFFGGAASVAVTTPIDRLMPIIQAAGSGQKQSISTVIRAKLAEEGASTIFRGWFMRTLHTGYHTVFAIFVADKLYSLIE